jgi:hypothetical protein
MAGQGLIVIGVNRSGTSAIAAALKELGVYFGPVQDLPATGLRIDYQFLENRHIVEMGGSILRELEINGSAAREVPKGWMNHAGLPRKVRSASEFIAAYFGDRPLWGWKDPRTSILIPFFEAAFSQLGVKPTYLMAVRHPMEVAKGLLARQNLPIREGVGHWIHYTLTALSEVDPERLALVPFHAFINDPRSVLGPIWERLELAAPSDALWQMVRAVVRPELDRTHETSDDLPQFAKRLWEFVSSLALDGRLQSLPPAQNKLRKLAEEWQEWSDLTRLSAIPVGEIRWLVSGKRGSTAFSGERVWHECVIRLPPGIKDELDLWFVPRYRILYLRNIEISSGLVRSPGVPTAGNGAFCEQTEDGEFKVFAFGAAEHVSIPIPGGRGSRELQFEFQVVAGKEGAMQNAHRLAAAYARLATI